MGLHLSSAWSTPRGWRLITVTLVALTLLLVVPLHRLSDDSPGVYGHLTNYLSHEGAAYDVEEGFVANLNETTTNQILNDKEPAEKVPYDTDSPQYTGEKDKQASDSAEKPAGAQHPEDDKKPDDAEDDGAVLEIDHGDSDTPQNTDQIHSEVPKETTKPESSETESQGVQSGEPKPQEDGNKPEEADKEHRPQDNTQPQSGEKKLQADETAPGDEQKQPHSETKTQESENKHQQGENKAQDDGDKQPDGIKLSDQSQNNNDHKNEDGDSATKAQVYQDSATTSIASEFMPSQTADLDVPSGPLSNWTGVCDGFPNTDGIMLVMKTGATEAFTKLPAHLLTSLQCLDDYLLFSDLVSKHSILFPQRGGARGAFFFFFGATDEIISSHRSIKGCS